MKTILNILFFVGFVGFVNSQNQKSNSQSIQTTKSQNTFSPKEGNNQQKYQVNPNLNQNSQSRTNNNSSKNKEYSTNPVNNGTNNNNKYYLPTDYSHHRNQFYNNSPLTRFNPKRMCRFPRNSFDMNEYYCCLWSLRYELMIQKWFLLSAILNSFEVTVTLKDWEIAEDKKAGTFLCDVVNSPESEISSKQICITLQKPTLYDPKYFEQNKTYTLFITKYSALEWYRVKDNKFAKTGAKHYYGFIIGNKTDSITSTKTQNTDSSK